jgi:hypothetical protein
MRFKFESGTFQFLSLSLFHLANHVCLSRGVQMVDAVWWAATRIVVRVGDLVQMIGDGCTSQILGGRTIRRSGDAVCDLHRAHGDEEFKNKVQESSYRKINPFSLFGWNSNF